MIVNIKSEFSGMHIINITGFKHIRCVRNASNIAQVIIEYMNETIITFSVNENECEILLQNLALDIKKEEERWLNARSYISGYLNKAS